MLGRNEAEKTMSLRHFLEKEERLSSGKKRAKWLPEGKVSNAGDVHIIRFFGDREPGPLAGRCTRTTEGNGVVYNSSLWRKRQ